MQGYSGFFDLVRVDKAVLDRLYEYDVGLMDQVSRLADAMESLRADHPSGTQQIPPLFEQIDALEVAWDRREDMLKGVD